MDLCSEEEEEEGGGGEGGGAARRSRGAGGGLAALSGAAGASPLASGSRSSGSQATRPLPSAEATSRSSGAQATRPLPSAEATSRPLPSAEASGGRARGQPLGLGAAASGGEGDPARAGGPPAPLLHLAELLALCAPAAALPALCARSARQHLRLCAALRELAPLSLDVPRASDFAGCHARVRLGPGPGAPAAAPAPPPRLLAARVPAQLLCAPVAAAAGLPGGAAGVWEAIKGLASGGREEKRRVRAALAQALEALQEFQGVLRVRIEPPLAGEAEEESQGFACVVTEFE